MAKYKLDSELFQPEVRVIAISSHVNDYRLCWAINRSLGLNLVRRRAEIVNEGPGRERRFPVFDCPDEESQTTISLVGNHADGGVLVLEQRQADFFLVVEEDSPLRTEEALDGIKKAEFVLAAFPVDFGSLRNGYKLLE